MKNRAGELVTNLSGKMAYKSFKPNPLPPIPAIRQDDEMVEYFKAHGALEMEEIYNEAEAAYQASLAE